jgi:hypothetical protein
LLQRVHIIAESEMTLLLNCPYCGTEKVGTTGGAEAGMTK